MENQYQVDALVGSLEQTLIEQIGELLDSESVLYYESIAKIKDSVKREDSELHILMAKASVDAYKRYHGLTPSKLAEMPSDETAKQIAIKHAKLKPESYYAEPFEPHQWVIDAINETLSISSTIPISDELIKGLILESFNSGISGLSVDVFIRKLRSLFSRQEVKKGFEEWLESRIVECENYETKKTTTSKVGLLMAQSSVSYKEAFSAYKSFLPKEDIEQKPDGYANVIVSQEYIDNLKDEDKANWKPVYFSSIPKNSIRKRAKLVPQHIKDHVSAVASSISKDREDGWDKKKVGEFGVWLMENVSSYHKQKTTLSWNEDPFQAGWKMYDLMKEFASAGKDKKGEK